MRVACGAWQNTRPRMSVVNVQPPAQVTTGRESEAVSRKAAPQAGQRMGVMGSLYPE